MSSDWPSVTQVLPKQDFFCTPEELAMYAKDGKENHAKFEMYLDTSKTYGDPDLIALDKLITENFKLLGNIVMFEERLESKKHKFTGKPDVIFEYAIADLKRSLSDKKYHALQLAGYGILAVENKIIKPTRKHYIIHKSGDKYKMVNVYNNLAKDVFISCVKKNYIDQNINNYLKGV